ncbi:MAG: 5-(carboxyamino)imidazole ribonucleotide synthase [Dehalococcoidia bacterium]
MSETTRRPPVVGIVGAGQLARMLIEAAIPLDVTVRLLAAAPDDGAALVSPHVLVAAPTDAAALARLAAGCDALTFDHELVDIAQLRALAEAGVVVRPSPETVATAQDKGRQRRLFRDAGLPVPPFAPAPDAAAITAFAASHGWPVVVKAERGGYDGRGVWVARDADEAAAVVHQAGGAPLMVEHWVPIEREVAALVARRPNGEAVVYPVVETVQRDGICHELLVPAPIPPALAAEAQRLALRVAEVTEATGMLALELFVTGGRLLVNEIAARPHNSGHFTIEGCLTSQFENHLRAVLDWPLGATDLVAPAVATVNLLGGPRTGDLAAALPGALAVRGARVHLYGKGARPGRKLGHVTALGSTIEDARARAIEAVRRLREGPEVGVGG